MKRVRIFLVFILSIAVFFASCDPISEYEKVVQNDSDFDVKIFSGFHTDWVNNPPDTFVINKNSSEVICSMGGIGSISDYENCYPPDSMTMLVYFGDSVKLIPDISDYWNFRVIKEGKFNNGICECRMILTNDVLTK